MTLKEGKRKKSSLSDSDKCSSDEERVETESEYIPENTEEKDTPLDPIEEICTQGESCSDEKGQEGMIQEGVKLSPIHGKKAPFLK